MIKLIALLLLITIANVNAAGRTIRWTAAGGTALWDFSRNWDCNCIPTADDNVIIDVPNIAGNVRIAANPAACASLTVGGSSQFGQSLYVQGLLMIGAGGAVINSNGDVTLDSSPIAPLISDGVFSGSSRFFFKSGTIAGKGQFIFESLNMTTPALKQINATTTVRGLLWVLPGPGQNALINVAQQTLTVAGNLQTEEALTIFSDDSQSASLDITGSLTYNGPSKQFIIRGHASINNLNVVNGQLTIQNSVDITNAMIAQGGSITIIGGPENQRNFGNVTGLGILTVQGGTNTIKAANLGTLQILAGKLSSATPLTFTNAQFTGGELAGKATVKVTSTSFGSATITSAAITTANLDIAGFSTLTGAASLTVTGAGKVSTAAQFTLNGGSVFSIAAGGQFTQANAFGIVPGADVAPSTLNNDGTWTSSANANIVVNTQGKGAWVSTATSTIAITGITFTIGSAQVAGSWKFLGVTGTIPALNGGGYVELNGKIFTIGTSSIGTLNHLNGQTTITSGTVGALSVANGNFIVSKLSVQSLNFTAGVVAGSTTTGSSLSSAAITLSGEAPKFVNNVKLISDEINWNCLGGSCQVVTNNAVFQTSSQKLSKH